MGIDLENKELSITTSEARTWSSAFATCPIEGNKFAIHMMELWDNNRPKYIEELGNFIIRCHNDLYKREDGKWIKKKG